MRRAFHRSGHALALDTEGKQVDSLTSNNGHLLWSGIVDKSKAKAVARHLLGPRLFSGWGVRTLAEGEGRYNPIGYHVGTVWPFDSSIVAWGLRRYGFKEEAAQIAAGILDAAAFDDFCHANDPHEEHDFGSFEVDGHTIFFKIDYFDRELSMHSPDPADPAITQRVITIMLAEDY